MTISPNTTIIITQGQLDDLNNQLASLTTQLAAVSATTSELAQAQAQLAVQQQINQALEAELASIKAVVDAPPPAA